MKKPQAYRIIEAGTNAENEPVGTVVYDCWKHDYGLASDDSRITGIPHKSVTLDPDGDYPSFTIQTKSLEKIDRATVGAPDA